MFSAYTHGYKDHDTIFLNYLVAFPYCDVLSYCEVTAKFRCKFDALAVIRFGSKLQNK